MCELVDETWLATPDPKMVSFELEVECSMNFASQYGDDGSDSTDLIALRGKKMYPSGSINVTS